MSFNLGICVNVPLFQVLALHPIVCVYKVMKGLAKGYNLLFVQAGRGYTTQQEVKKKPKKLKSNTPLPPAAEERCIYPNGCEH